MKLTQFMRQEHRLLSDAINEALKPIAAQFGVSLKASGGVVGSRRGRVHIEVELETKPGEKSPAQVQFDAYCRYSGFKPEHFGQTFVSNGKLFRISGVKPGAPKYDLLADEVGGRGRTFKFVGSQIARQFQEGVKKAA